MSTRLQCFVAILAAGLSGTLSLAPAVAAGTDAGVALKKCASKSEFDQIHQGQTMAKVHGILDQQRVIYGYAVPGGNPAALEQYATCGWSAKYVTVYYVGGLGSPYTVKSKALKPFQGSTSRVDTRRRLSSVG